MKHHARLVLAIFVKDVRLFWPLAALAFVLDTLYIVSLGEEISAASQLLSIVLPFAAFVAVGFTIVSVIHADSPASTQTEWLTRPIPPAALIAAKSAFVLLLTLIPTLIGEAIVALRDERSWSEVTVAALSLQPWVIAAILALCAVAVLTATLLECATVIAAAFLSTLTLVPLATWLSGTGEEIYASGAAWVAEQPRFLVVVAVSMTIAGWMYARRRVRQGRIVFAVCAGVLIVSPLLLSWRPVFAAQKRLSAQPNAADSFELTRDGTCLSAILVDPPLDAEDVPEEARIWSIMSRRELAPGLWDPARRRRAGSHAIGFETRVLASGVPKGWRAVIERVDGTYIDESHQELLRLRPAQFTPVWRTVDSGTRAASHFWLLARSEHDRLANTTASLSLNYALSLLRPRASAEMEADGVRRHLPGIGFCDAQFDVALSAIKVDCFIRGDQPAQLTANLMSGAPDTEVASNFPDYTPAALEWMTGHHHTMTLTDVAHADASRIKLTSYEPRAHFERTVVIDGVLGASASACPPPTRSTQGRTE